MASLIIHAIEIRGSVVFAGHIMANVNLGAGHDMVCGEMTGSGKIDIIARPLSASENNAVDGNAFILFLENLSP